MALTNAQMKKLERQSRKIDKKETVRVLSVALLGVIFTTSILGGLVYFLTDFSVLPSMGLGFLLLVVIIFATGLHKPDKEIQEVIQKAEMQKKDEEDNPLSLAEIKKERDAVIAEYDKQREMREGKSEEMMEVNEAEIETSSELKVKTDVEDKNDYLTIEEMLTDEDKERLAQYQQEQQEFVAGNMNPVEEFYAIQRLKEQQKQMEQLDEKVKKHARIG